MSKENRVQCKGNAYRQLADHGGKKCHRPNSAQCFDDRIGPQIGTGTSA